MTLKQPVQQNQVGDFYVKNIGDTIDSISQLDPSLIIRKLNASSSAAVLSVENIGSGPDIFAASGGFLVYQSGTIIDTLTINHLNTLTNLTVVSGSIQNLEVANGTVSGSLVVADLIGTDATINDLTATLITGTSGIYQNFNVQNLEVANGTVSGALQVFDLEASGATISLLTGTQAVIDTIEAQTVNTVNFSGAEIVANNVTIQNNLIVSGSLFSSSGEIDSLQIGVLGPTLTGNVTQLNSDRSVFQIQGAGSENPIFEAVSGIAQIPVGIPSLSIVGSSSPYSLYFGDGSSAAVNLLDSLYDAVVPDNYATPKAALDAGKRRILVKDGNYNDTGTGTITLSTAATIVGTNISTVIWRFDSLVFTAINSQLMNMTLGNGSTNSSVVIGPLADKTVLKDLIVNITGGFSIPIKIDVQAADCLLSNIYESVATASRTFLKLSATSSRCRLDRIFANNLAFSTDISYNNLDLRGTAHTITNISSYANVPYSIACTYSTIDGIYNEVATPIIDRNIIHLDNCSNTTLRNLSFKAQRDSSGSLNCILVKNQPSNVNISDVTATIVYSLGVPASTTIRLLSFDNSINGLSLSRVNCTVSSVNGVGIFRIVASAAVVPITVQSLFLNTIQVSCQTNLSNLMGVYLDTSIVSSITKVSLKGVNIRGIETNSITTAGMLICDTTNVVTKEIEVSNCTFTNFSALVDSAFVRLYTGGGTASGKIYVTGCETQGTRVIVINGSGFGIYLTDINFLANSSAAPAVDLEGTFGNVNLSHINRTLVGGQFLKLTTVFGGTIRYVTVNSCSCATAGGNYIQLINNHGSAFIQFVSVAGGTVDNVSAGSPLFNSSGVGIKKGIVTGVLYNLGGSVLASADWETSTTNTTL